VSSAQFEKYVIQSLSSEKTATGHVADMPVLGWENRSDNAFCEHFYVCVHGEP